MAEGHGVIVGACHNYWKALDRLIDRIAAAFGFVGNRLVGGEAKPVLVTQEVPYQRVQDALGAGKRR